MSAEHPPKNTTEHAPSTPSAPAHEAPSVKAEQSPADKEAANQARERLHENAEKGHHEHPKQPNYFQEHLTKIKDATKEESVLKAGWKISKSVASIGLGLGVVAEGAAALVAMEGAGAVGLTNFVWHSILGHQAFSYAAVGGAAQFLFPAGVILGLPYLWNAVFDMLNKAGGGSGFKLGSGGGAGGGGSHSGGGH